MAMSYDEVLNVWGRKLLKDRGYIVAEDAKISVEVETETSGYCDTCTYESAVVVISVVSKIRSDRASISIDGYSFREILLELVEVSANS